MFLMALLREKDPDPAAVGRIVIDFDESRLLARFSILIYKGCRTNASDPTPS